MKKCPDDYIGRWFSVLHRLSISHVVKGLKEFNIGSGQIMFLLELYHCDGVNQEELSSYLNIDGANTTRAIKKLEQEGYVIRKADVNDKRAYRVYLTSKALEIKPQILALLKEWEDTFLQDLSVEERAALLDLLKKIGHSIFDNPRCGMCNNNCC